MLSGRLCSSDRGRPAELAGFVFAIDGTLLRSQRALPGAAAVLAALRRRGKRLLLLTNDSQQTPASWATVLLSSDEQAGPAPRSLLPAETPDVSLSSLLGLLAWLDEGR